MATKAQKKQWVYKRLVKNDKDLVGLIAYGFYKSRKTELADDFRKKGHSEDEIDRKLADFHDQEVSGNGALDQYRARAEHYLNRVFETTHTHAKLEAIDSVLEKATKEKREMLSALKQGWLWLVSGVPSGLATIVLTVIVFGGMMYFASPHQRAQIASDLVNKAVGEEMVTPKEPLQKQGK